MNVSQRISLFLILLVLTGICVSSCKDDTIEPGQLCNDSLRPIVMAHGFMASGDTYAKHFQRFTSNDYCPERLFVFDWNTLGTTDNIILLDAFIDTVLQLTGATQVDLAGHSAGGGLGYDYLANALRASKVAHYAHIGSSLQSAPAGPNGEVPTLNLWSQDDEVVSDKGDIPGATNVMLTGADHYQVATTAESFQAIYSFFNNGKQPETTEIKAENEIKLSGRALSFGENVPEIGATVDIYEGDPNNGNRITPNPNATFNTSAQGHWGPFTATTGTTYEFVVTTADTSARQIHFYREGFRRSDKLVYLRTLPSPGSLAGIMLSSLPDDPGQAALAVFSSSQAVIDTRDFLEIGQTVLSTTEFASADQTTIAFFIYDDGDGQTSGDALGFFSQLPFINGVDMYFPTDQLPSIELEFNGRKLFAKSWPSSEGLVVPIFD